MVIYDLVCEQQHRFEGWFRSSDDFNHQHLHGMLTCPVCNNVKITKLPSASYINSGISKSVDRQNDQISAKTTQQQNAIQLLREYLQHHSVDVGKDFVEEAKKIHYGEAKPRNIHGRATVTDLIELHEEGVSAFVLPVDLPEKKNLN